MNPVGAHTSPGRPTRTVWWVLATPVLQVATAVLLGMALMVIAAIFDGGWGIVLAFLAGLVIGPALVLGVIVTMARRNAQARLPVLVGAVVGLASLAVLVLLLGMVDAIAFPVYLATSMVAVAWATRRRPNNTFQA